MTQEARLTLAVMAAGFDCVQDPDGRTIRDKLGMPALGTAEFLARVEQNLEVLKKYDPEVRP